MKKTVKIKKYPDGSKGTKPTPSFAKNIKPLTEEQKAKGVKINELDKKKKLFPDGTKKIDNYTREKKVQTVPAKKGKLYIKEGTVQRKPVGKGVEFVPKEKEKDISNSKGKIVDPKSKKTEDDNQAALRKAALDEHKKVDLSKSKKEGDYVTYKTAKGTQVAGKVEKEKDTPAEYKTVRQVEVHKKGDVVPRLEGTKEQQEAKRKELKAKGYYNQPGTESYIKKDESKFIDEEELEKHQKEGWTKSGAVNKKNAAILAKGAKKMKIGKMC